MVYQVHLQVSGLLQVVGKPEHRHIPTPGVVVLGGTREGARLVPRNTLQETPEGGHTDAGQWPFLFRGPRERSLASQMLGGGKQRRLKPLRTGIVQRPGHYSDDPPSVGAIGRPSLPASGTPLEVRAHETDEALSAQAGAGFPFVQQASLFLTVRLLIPFLHPAQD